MKLDYGFTEYNTEKAKPIFSWKSLLDYDPNSSSLELAVGDHYTIYKDDKGSYFLYCRHRIQRSSEGLQSYPKRIAERVLSIAAGETPNIGLKTTISVTAVRLSKLISLVSNLSTSI